MLGMRDIFKIDDRPGWMRKSPYWILPQGQQPKSQGAAHRVKRKKRKEKSKARRKNR